MYNFTVTDYNGGFHFDLDVDPNVDQNYARKEADIGSYLTNVVVMGGSPVGHK